MTSYHLVHTHTHTHTHTHLDAAPSTSSDSTWPRLKSPHRKKEKKDKDVFRFLKGGDANYTVRRQQFQLSIVLEKNRFVKNVSNYLLFLNTKLYYIQ